jgi:hypothetical protein
MRIRNEKQHRNDESGEDGNVNRIQELESVLRLLSDSKITRRKFAKSFVQTETEITLCSSLRRTLRIETEGWRRTELKEMKDEREKIKNEGLKMKTGK